MKLFLPLTSFETISSAHYYSGIYLSTIKNFTAFYKVSIK